MKTYIQPQTETSLLSMNNIICASPNALGVGEDILPENSMGD